jgi:hypothetical protein
VTGNAEPGEKYGRAFSPSPLARRLFPRVARPASPEFSTVSKNYAPRCQRCQNNHVARAEIRCECPLPTPSSAGSEPTSKSLKGQLRAIPAPEVPARSDPSANPAAIGCRVPNAVAGKAKIDQAVVRSPERGPHASRVAAHFIARCAELDLLRFRLGCVTWAA